jgi:hypothetical protein
VLPGICRLVITRFPCAEGPSTDADGTVQASTRITGAQSQRTSEINSKSGTCLDQLHRRSCADSQSHRWTTVETEQVHEHAFVSVGYVHAVQVDGAAGDERLWIVCPSYADVPSFLMLRDRILEILHDSHPLHGLGVTFVVVDDTGGFDREIEQLRILDDVRVVTVPFNVGHQRAIVCGLRVILPEVGDSDLLVTMDADGEDLPEDLPRLIAPLLGHGGEIGSVCIARRTKRSESIRFRMMYICFRLMFRVLTGVTVRNGNFAAYRGILGKRVLQHPYFDLCYSSTLISLDLPLTEVSCARGKRYVGRSRMNFLRLFLHGIRMLMPFTDRIAVRALTLFSAIFGAGILLAMFVLGAKLFSTAAIPGWTTTMLLGVLILSIMSLGNFVVLFAVFSHSRGVSLASLEEWVDTDF